MESISLFICLFVIILFIAAPFIGFICEEKKTKERKALREKDYIEREQREQEIRKLAQRVREQREREQKEREKIEQEQQEQKRRELEQNEREALKNEVFAELLRRVDGSWRKENVEKDRQSLQLEQRENKHPIEAEQRIDIAEIDQMEGHQFEYYCAGLLRKLNYSNVEVTKGSGDQGVDIIAVKDSIRYAIQCKRYSTSLGNSPVQEVNAGKQLYHCHVAVVITNQYFTAGAKQLALANGVLLWDRDKLKDMVKQAGGITR